MKHDPTPFKTSEIVELLWAYQGVIGIRPFSEGNREFLEVLFGATRKLGVALKRTPLPTGLNRNDVGALIGLIEEQAVTNYDVLSPGILDLIGKFRRLLLEPDTKPTIQGSLSKLSADYVRITAIFGPASGMGDQITYFQFFRTLRDRCPNAEIVVYSLYPDLWKNLIPGTLEMEFRGEPIRPFENLKQVTNGREDDGLELVVCADFESFDLHKKLVPIKRNRDVLELAMGRWKVSLNEHSSPWYKEKVYKTLIHKNNYSYVDALSSDLLGTQLHHSLWSGVVNYRSSPDTPSTFKIFLNTFSSKELPYRPEHWAQLIRQIRKKVPRGTSLELIVFPGLDRTTREYVAEIFSEMAILNPAVVCKVLTHPDGSDINPQNAIDSIVSQAAHFDCCITLDTFTAHLVPLFGLLTFVIAYKENREFWVPSPWVFYVTLKTVERDLPALIGTVMHMVTEEQPANPAMRKVVEAGQLVMNGRLDEGALQNVVGTLYSLLRNIDDEFPYLWQARQWMLKWSQLAAANKLDPISPVGIFPFLFNWTGCEFYKLLFLMSSTKEEDEIALEV